MKTGTITNHYRDFYVFDLDPSPERGPFVVIQEGCAPGDHTATQKIFVLQRDGVWAELSYYLAGPGKKRLEVVVFYSLRETLQVLGQMDSTVRISSAQATVQELVVWHASHPRIDGLAGLQQWAQGFRAAHRIGV